MTQIQTSRPGNRDWVDEMMAHCVENDEQLRWRSFMAEVPCGELRCRLSLTQAWDVDGIRVTHNGVAHIISPTYSRYCHSDQMKRKLIKWIQELHADPADLGDGAVRFVECS